MLQDASFLPEEFLGRANEAQVPSQGHARAATGEMGVSFLLFSPLSFQNSDSIGDSKRSKDHIVLEAWTFQGKKHAWCSEEMKQGCASSAQPRCSRSDPQATL